VLLNPFASLSFSLPIPHKSRFTFASLSFSSQELLHLILELVVGSIGPFEIPLAMLERGRKTRAFFNRVVPDPSCGNVHVPPVQYVYKDHRNVRPGRGLSAILYERAKAADPTSLDAASLPEERRLFLDLLSNMLAFDPSLRPSPADAFRHPFFRESPADPVCNLEDFPIHVSPYSSTNSVPPAPSTPATSSPTPVASGNASSPVSTPGHIADPSCSVSVSSPNAPNASKLPRMAEQVSNKVRREERVRGARSAEAALSGGPSSSSLSISLSREEPRSGSVASLASNFSGSDTLYSRGDMEWYLLALGVASHRGRGRGWCVSLMSGVGACVCVGSRIVTRAWTLATSWTTLRCIPRIPAGHATALSAAESIARIRRPSTLTARGRGRLETECPVGRRCLRTRA
jgi:serine/threonine protein kinase